MLNLHNGLLSADNPNSWQYKSRPRFRIINVYQTQKLVSGHIPQGFGDYIRGSLSVLQTARRLGIEFDMAIQHPLAQWLQPAQQYTNTVADINFIETQNQCRRIIQACKSTRLFVYVHAFPDPVCDDDKQTVWKHLQPNAAMTAYRTAVYEAMKIVPGQYEVIHIRCGDTHIRDTHVQFQTGSVEGFRSVPTDYVNEALARMRPGTRYVVLSDNAEVKSAIKAQFAGAIVRESEILHLGTSIGFSAAGVRDTLLDFYILGDAARVTALSAYSHGSGFSQWACELRKVPYTCTFMSSAKFTLVYKTYGPDLPWLKHSLKSVKKYVAYYTALVIYCHDEAVEDLRSLLREVDVAATVIPVRYTMHGYIQQQIVKLECYKDVETPFLVIMDSDVMFTAPFDLRTLMQEKISWTYSTKAATSSALEWSVWKEAYEAMTKTPHTLHFMTNHFPFVLTRTSLATAADEFQKLHGVDYAAFCQARLHALHLPANATVRDYFAELATVFTEFEWIGFACMRHCPQDYYFTTKVVRNVPATQFWSHGGVNAVKTKLNVITM